MPGLLSKPSPVAVKADYASIVSTGYKRSDMTPLYTVKFLNDHGFPGIMAWGISLLDQEPVGIYKSKELAQENADRLNSITPEYPGDCHCGSKLYTYLKLSGERKWFCPRCQDDKP